MSIIEELYTDNQNLINKKVHEYVKKTHLDFEEIKAQANLIFCESYNTHNKNKSSFSTFLFYSLDWGLKKYLNKINTNDFVFKNNDFFEKNIVYNDYQFNSIIFNEKIYKLNDDCKEIVSIVMEKPDKAKSNKHSIKQYLRKLGWKIPRINQAFNTIELELCNEES